MKCAPIITPEIERFGKCLANPLPYDRRPGCFEEAWAARNSVVRAVQIASKEHPIDPFFGMGAFRSVIDLGNGCVMKIANDKDGAKSNRIEVATYKKILRSKKRTLIDMFVPITAAGRYGEYVVMPKVDTGKPIDWRKLKRRLDRNHIVCPDVLARSRNVGVYRGEPVILDYGFGVKCTIHRRR